MRRAVLFWSSGKDSAAALQAVRDDLEITALVTTVNRPQHHVAVHRVPEALLDLQAASVGIPLEKVAIPSPCPNDEYEQRVLRALRGFRDEGVETVVFGDINLADVRAYREELLSRADMEGAFPLWERDTRALSRHQIASGIRAVVTCVDNKALSCEYVGRRFDTAFLRSLPASADPCGENGEFHTFVYDAGVFSRPVPVEVLRTFDDGAFSYAIIAGRTEEADHVE